MSVGSVNELSDKNFITMYNYYLMDKNLSLKAKGLLATISLYPNDCDFTISELCRCLKESRCAVKNAIYELNRLGYCKITKTTNSCNSSVKHSYVFYGKPIKY